MPWDGATFTEGWEDALFGFSTEGEWHKIEFDLEMFYSIDEDEEQKPSPRRAIANRVVQFKRPEEI
jgi:hypothetical protein